MSILQSLTLSEIHENFCIEASILRNLTPQTVAWYKNAFRNLLRYKPLTHHSQLNELELTQFFFWGRKECNWSAVTSLNYYSSLSSFFTWCLKKEVIKDNPLENIPRPKIPKSLPKALSEKETRVLFEHVQLMPVPSEYKPAIFHKRRDVAIFALFLFTGVRRQELLNLQVSDVNLDEDIIMIREGKGMKDRTIPISFALKKYLALYIQERDKEGVFSPYLLTSLQYRGRLSVRTLTRLLQRVKKSTGIYFTSHILRHTYATLMVKSKCDLKSLSQMMGHSDIRTTACYLSASTEHLKTQINNHPLNFF